MILSLQSYAQCWQTVSSGSDHTLAIQTDGTLWAWGDNFNGELGDGTTVGKNQPVQIGTANDWQKISAGENFSLAIKNNGTLWAWGYNILSQLGNGSISVIQATPIQIGTATDWKNISAAPGRTGAHSLALKTNGTLWAWGYNERGQLGNGSLGTRTQPVQIGADTWLAIAAGGSHSVAIKANGTLWAWGWNGVRQLGDGTNVDKTVPTQIGTATNWKSIDCGYIHNLAIKTDGTLWAWGSGLNGKLGTGNNITSGAPIQIGTDNNWASAMAGTDHSLALKTNGTLWSWGKNENGELGLGTNSTTDIMVPTQASTNADKTFIAAGQDYSQIMNSDGYLYATGINAAGQLGDGTNVNRNTLTAVTCASLSNEEFQAANSIKVFPNPSRDILNFTSGEEITKVALYDLLGQEMASKNVSANEGTLDLSQLGRGAYILRVQCASSIKTLKIAKE